MMFRRPAYLYALAMAMLPKGLPEAMAQTIRIPAQAARMARQNFFKSRTKRYGAHANPKHFTGIQREIVQAAVDKRARKALRMHA